VKPSWFGLLPGDQGKVRRLGGIIACANLAEVVAEGAATAAFLARVGAAALPMAIALRALVEVICALGYDHLTRNASPQKTLRTAQWLSAAVLLGAGLALHQTWGAYAVFVVVSALARLRVIHFGVLALADLGAAAPRALPIVYGLGRGGAIVAGPLLAVSAGIGLGPLFFVAAASQLLALLWLRGGAPLPKSQPGAAHFARLEDAPPSALPRSTSIAGHQLVYAILVGTVALALGRLALTTQSGAILEAHFDEHSLARVLGIYFAIANFVALALQLGWVGRMLSRGGLAWLNSGWAVCYLVAQIGLVWLPPSVALALGARSVEGELRNAVRTPVANLLYDVLPLSTQARSRTMVIGVALPIATLLGGLALTWLHASRGALASFGIGAAIVLLCATFAQNRIYSRAAGARDS
jgi:hypothetical protein